MEYLHTVDMYSTAYLPRLVNIVCEHPLSIIWNNSVRIELTVTIGVDIGTRHEPKWPQVIQSDTLVAISGTKMGIGPPLLAKFLTAKIKTIRKVWQSPSLNS